MDGARRHPATRPVVLGAAAVGLVLLEGMRVWLPSVLFVVGDAGSTSAVTMGAFALGVLAVTVATGELAGRTNPRWWWVLTGVVALGALLGLGATEGGTAQALLSSLVVLGAGAALTALAAGAHDASDARTGLLGGVAASSALHAALGSVDLTWRDGLGARAATAALVTAAAVAMAMASRELAARPPAATEATGTTAPGWPWFVLAPTLGLVLLLVAPVGRAAIALGTTGPTATVAAIGLLALLPAGALLARASRGRGTLVVGAGLVLVGTAGALDAAGPRAVASQASLALGLGLVVGGLRGGETGPGGARAGRAAGSALLGLGVLVFAYYAPYDLPLPFNNRGVPLAAAGALLVTAAAALRRPGPVGRDVRAAPTLAALGIVLVLGLVLAAPSLLALRAQSGPTPATPSAPTSDELTVLLANVRMGHDEDGRFRASAVASLITESDADIVVLNELDRGWATTGSHDLGAVLARATGMTLVFAPAADEVWGNAILTRLPVREVEVERLPRGTDAMARSVIVVVLALDDDRDLAVVGTHLSAVDRRGDTRLPQAQVVAAAAARMRDRGIPTVVAGDLNAVPGDPELEAFADLVGPTLPPGRPTHPASRPTVQIDHVLVSSELEVRAAEVLADRLSDHRFVRVVLGLDGAAVEPSPAPRPGDGDTGDG
ncbi:MAG: hypothetical protein RLZZ272_807 [Actinomycetota bacterium]